MDTSSLSRPRLDLVGKMQELEYGWIEHLQVVKGEPVLQPPPRIVHNVHLGKARPGGQAPPDSGFQLKKQIVELFDLFDREQTFKIEKLEVHDGLPFKIDYPDSAGK